MDRNETIKEWIITGTAPEKYQVGMDYKMYHTGTKSATLKSIADEFEAGEFATIMQQFNATNFIGKRVRFSGFVKTQEVEGWCGLWMRIDNALSTILKFDNMQSRSITGTTEWNHYFCVLMFLKTVPLSTSVYCCPAKGRFGSTMPLFRKWITVYRLPTLLPVRFFPTIPKICHSKIRIHSSQQQQKHPSSLVWTIFHS